tara:strand:- start:356 stop:610 length:255 start_codon:yes stop_codon:yes gene_type:complete
MAIIFRSKSKILYRVDKLLKISIIKIKEIKKGLPLDLFEAQKLTDKEIRNISGGFRLNLFGIYYVEGVLDGIKGNTRGHWSWKP